MPAATTRGRKTQKAGAPTPTSTNFINSNNIADSATALRLQRLRPFGLAGHRASLIASMAWEVAHG